MGVVQSQETGRTGPAPTSRPEEPSARTGSTHPERYLVRGLGWFSIALGAAQMAAPRRLARFIGIDDGAAMPLLGLREFATGVGILTRDQPAGWLWARLAGDTMDLALLGGAMAVPRNDRRRLTGATVAVLGVTALDWIGARRLRRGDAGAEAARERRIARSSIAVNASPATCYALWRDHHNLPRFMRHVDSVEVLDDRRSHWVVQGPARTKIEWDSEITEDRRGELIAWRAANSMVPHAGSVRFEGLPGNRGTIVHVEMQYDPPGGPVGATVAKLLGRDPHQEVKAHLRAFKQILELGEIPTTAGQPSGPRGLVGGTVLKTGALS